MNVTDRPDPAVRRPPRVTVDGDAALKTLGVTTINERAVECQACWNRTVFLTLNVKRDWFTRGALIVVTLAALLSAWLAWDAHADLAEAKTNHQTHKDQ